MTERKAFLLRIDPQVHDALKRWAEDELRSLNAQAEIVLREALKRHGRLKAEAAESPPTPSEEGGGAEASSDEPSSPD